MISAYFDLNVFDYLRRHQPSTKLNRKLHSKQVQIYTSFIIYEELLALSLSNKPKFNQIYRWIKELRTRNIYTILVPYICSEIKWPYKRKKRRSPYITRIMRRNLLASYPTIASDSEIDQVIQEIRGFKNNIANSFNTARDNLRSDPRFKRMKKPKDIAKYANDYAPRWITEVHHIIQKKASYKVDLHELQKCPAMIVFSKHLIALECQMSIEGRSFRPNDSYDLLHSVYASRVDYLVTQDMDFGTRYNKYVKPNVNCAPALDFTEFSRIITKKNI